MIGAMRPLVIGLLLLDCWTQGWCSGDASRVLRFGERRLSVRTAVRRFVGARLLTNRYDPSVMKAEAQLCALACFACTVELASGM